MAPTEPVTDWQPPLRGRVVRRFDPPATRYGRGHRGVDLAGEPGEVVHAAGPGVVLFAGRLGPRGLVSIEHADGSRTTYEPLRPLVRTGATVVAGTPIGLLSAGHRGCEEAACLHWGLIRGGDYHDPLSLLGFGSVRLYPVALWLGSRSAGAA